MGVAHNCTCRGAMGLKVAKRLFDEDRLDAWFDGSAIQLIAVSSHGDPLDLGEGEVQAFIDKLQSLLAEAKG